MARKLTKTDVESIAHQIEHYYDANIDEIATTIHENVLSEGHIRNSNDNNVRMKQLITNLTLSNHR